MAKHQANKFPTEKKEKIGPPGENAEVDFKEGKKSGRRWHAVRENTF
jgi:hypothetical protein